MSQSSSRMNTGTKPQSGRGPANRGSNEPEGNMATQAYENAESCVQNYPSTSVAVTFAVGFGVGMLLVYSLVRPAPTPQGRMTQMGRRTWDALSHALPDAISSRMHG